LKKTAEENFKIQSKVE